MQEKPDEFGSTYEYITQLIRRKGRHVNLYDYLKANPHEFLHGILVAGSIGSGKTQRAMRIFRAALDSGFGGLVFDPSNDYQRLVQFYPEAVVIDVMEFYQNPLEPPPDMSMDEWKPIFIQVFSQTFGLKDPTMSIIQLQLNILIEERGKIPTLTELYDAIGEYIPRSRSQETSSHASALNRLELILNSPMARCLDVRHGFQPTDFEEGLLVVKLRPLGIERVHEFMINIAIAKLHAYRSDLLRRGQRAEKNVFVVIEEAHRFLSEKRQGDRFGQRMYVERALVESRKLGMGFMIVDQLPHEVSSYVTSSCNMWIVCRLVDADARKMVGDVLCLDYLWTRDGLMELPIGAAFIRVERMDELEEASPLVESFDDVLESGTKNLPAIVAAPVSQKDLLHSLAEPIEYLMVQNQRYLRFFERNARQDIERIRESVSGITRTALEAFLERTIRRTNTSNQDLLSLYNLQDSGISRRYAIDEEGTSLTRQQIDELTRYLRILASKPCRTILVALNDTKPLTNSELMDTTGLSKSWLSRVLARLCREELISKIKSEDARAIYEMSIRGRGVLRWARELDLPKTMNTSFPRTSIKVAVMDANWLLESLKQARELREDLVIAGWMGDISTQDELFRLEMLSRYIIEKGEEHREKVRTGLNNPLLQSLSKGFDYGVLSTLLKSRTKIPYSEAVNELQLDSSTLRRIIANLERFDVIERERRTGEIYLILSEEFRKHFMKPYAKRENMITIDRMLVGRLCRVVLDMILLKEIIGLKNEYSFESSLRRCLSGFSNSSNEGI